MYILKLLDESPRHGYEIIRLLEDRFMGLYAPSAGAVVLKVHAGDKVAKGQVLALVDSPELNAKLAQEQSNADALRADVLRTEVDARQQKSALQSVWDNANIDKARRLLWPTPALRPRRDSARLESVAYTDS